MEKRKQFTMYESMYKALARIKDRDDRLSAYDIICAYALYGEEPDLETMSDAVAITFELVQPVLDTARRKAESGRLGGSKSKAQDKQPESKPQSQEQQPAREKEGEKEIEIEKELEIESEIEIERETEIEAKPEAAESPAQNAERAFSSFWEDYPKKTDRDEALQIWKELDPDRETVQRIRESLADWKKSGQWLDDDGRYIPSAARWLRKRRWEMQPAPGKKQIPTGASGQLGQAELEAIQRVLREREFS